MKVCWFESLVFLLLGIGMALSPFDRWVIDAFIIFALQMINYRVYKVQKQLAKED
jgi:NhaP-type Na+/H+ or K+/H+ antiporter